MSMYEIEGLIDESVRLVAKSKMTVTRKRNFLFTLYNFQYKFDTGYTHFRVIDTLLDLKFTYRIPLKKHPDYDSNKTFFEELYIESSKWLPSTIDKEGEFVYSKKEEEGVFLYADAGSMFWKRLCKEKILPKTEHKAPSLYKSSSLLLSMLQEAQRQYNQSLLSDWYALLVNLVDIDLCEEDGFPKRFQDFIAQKEVKEIRQIGIINMPFAKKRSDNASGALETPVLKEIEDIENDVDRLYCVKWLLDFESDEAKIKADYAKEIGPDLDKEVKLKIIPKAFEYHLGTKNWNLVWSTAYEYGHKWLYHHQLRGEEGKPADTDLHQYYFFDADYNDLKLPYPKVCIQHGLLNRWQGRTAIHSPECIHFFQSLASHLPEKDWSTNKSLHYMGGWKFSLKSSENTLRKHVDNMFDSLKKYTPVIISEYKKPLFNDFQMSVKEAKDYLEKKMQTHQYFQNYIELRLVYAIYYFEKGDAKKAFDLAKETKIIAQEKKHPVKEEWIAAAQRVLEGKPRLNELLNMQRKYF